MVAVHPMLEELKDNLQQYIVKKRKRDNYNNYSKNYTGDFFDNLFREIEEMKEKAPSLAEIAEYFSINRTTLASRLKKWRKAGGKGKDGCIDKRGEKRRRLPEDVEQQVCEDILRRVVAGEERIDFSTVQSLLHAANPLKPYPSTKYVSNVLKRHGLTPRLTPIKKRVGRKKLAVSDAELEEEIINFMCDVHDALRKYGACFVFNMDEKPLAGAPKKVWSIQVRGKKTIPIGAKGSPRRCLTGVVTVSAAGDMLSAVIIKAGKKENAPIVKQLRRDAEQYGNYVVMSQSGWMNSQVMIWYLENIVHAHTHGTPCALILDNYGAHTTDEVLAKAAALNIELIMMPPNVTKYCQPLDVGVFGPLQKQMDARWKSVDDLFDYVWNFHDLLLNFPSQLITGAFAKAATSLTAEDIAANLFVLRPLTAHEEAMQAIDDIMFDFMDEEEDMYS